MGRERFGFFDLRISVSKSLKQASGPQRRIISNRGAYGLWLTNELESDEEIGAELSGSGSAVSFIARPDSSLAA